jgi:hypothetical protein
MQVNLLQEKKAKKAVSARAAVPTTAAATAKTAAAGPVQQPGSLVGTSRIANRKLWSA